MSFVSSETGSALAAESHSWLMCPGRNTLPDILLSLISKAKEVSPLSQQPWKGLGFSVSFTSLWNLLSYYLSYLGVSHYTLQWEWRRVSGCSSLISYSTALPKQLDLHTGSCGTGEGCEPSCLTGSWALSRHIPAESAGIWMREGLDILILD